jgi:hypothetical protein
MFNCDLLEKDFSVALPDCVFESQPENNRFPK